MIHRRSLMLPGGYLLFVLSLIVGCGSSSAPEVESTSVVSEPADTTMVPAADQSMISSSTRDNVSDSTVTSRPFSLTQPSLGSVEQQVVPSRRLSRQLTPSQLVQFLSGADEDLRNVVAQAAATADPPTQASQQEMVDELKRIVSLKREASQRLIEHESSTAANVATGQRGLMQALSHLASLGDLSAAEELQAVSERLAGDPDPGVRADSQLVLIGFALEQLRFGKAGSADKVIAAIESFFASDAQADVAALMVMGQAKDTLLQYGYTSQAETVRKMVFDRFSQSPHPSVVELASQVAGQPILEGPLAAIDSIRQRWLDDSRVSEAISASDLASWRAAVTELGSQKNDLTSVRTLAVLGLETEAAGRSEMSQAVEAVLETIAKEPTDAGREAKTAVEARKNRRAVIGGRLDPDLPSISGDPLSMKAFRGKVVLMPFWSAEFPQSLSVLAACRDVMSQYPDKVEIVGMNLDAEGVDVASFAKSEGLDFQSYRSVSDPDQPIVNEVAYRFGAVTLVYVALIDTQGRVAAVNFSGRDLAKQVASLLE